MAARPDRWVERGGVHGGRWDPVRARVRDGRWGVTAIGALAVAAAALCLTPLLDGPWWFGRVVAAVALVAVVGGLCRSLRVPAPLTPLLQFAALMALLVWNFAREEAAWGFVPGPAAVGRLRDLAAQGRDYAMDTQPPAGPDPGLLLLIMAGIGLAALVVDTLAAGLDLPGLTLIPMAALFVVPWVINRGSAPWWTFAVVALGWLAILSALQRDRAARWSPGARPSSPGTGLAIAGTATALALVAGGLGTLRGPAEPVGPGAGSGGGPVEIDALVSLRRSLVSNDTRPVMTFAATTPSPDYLRLSILEDFDGETWRPVAPNETGPQPPALPDGSIPSAQQPPAGPVAEYQIDVGPLAGSTLPSPPGTFDSLTEWPVVWDQRTSLPLRADDASVQGTRVGLVAAEQDQDSSALRAASALPPRPEQVFAENLADPGPLTGPELSRLAEEITAGAGSPFDAAVALQRWFTTEGGFVYSTQVDGGSGGDALADFLDQRIGYCEQFAATMALMARSVGIPARVAVGFTQGRREGTQWVVRGTDAHAWPELWMGSAGWIRFEPTPGAPTSATPLYTLGADPDQDQTETPVQESEAPEAEVEDPAGQLPDEADGSTSAEQGGTRDLPVRLILVLLIGGLLLLPAGVRLIRRHRRRRVGDGESAYQEVVDTLLDLRLGSPAATPRSTLAVVSGALGPPEPGADRDPGDQALGRIRRSVEWQRYGTPARQERADPTEGDPTAARFATAQTQAGPTAVLTVGPDPGSGAPDVGQGLADDVRIVRRSLARRAGPWRRLVAVVAPPSITGPLLGRGPGR